MVQPLHHSVPRLLGIRRLRIVAHCNLERAPYSKSYDVVQVDVCSPRFRVAFRSRNAGGAIFVGLRASYPEIFTSELLYE